MCLKKVWPAWFAPPGADSSSLALVVTAGRRSCSGRLLAVVSRAPSLRYSSALFDVSLDLTSLACLWLENCLLFWELRLRFVQHQMVLLPDAPNGVVSIGVVRLLPALLGMMGLGAMPVS
ncbi:hypothetical protein V6N11_018418 [Hibiscus sabdariffa]|uniref:Uncharacterized protein n=1 Tax=Hibiscus sabdariffa TaxID=183260 RepID=A0ABR2T7C5_9ROSI